MTPSPNEHQPPGPCCPERSEQTPSGAVDRLAAGVAPSSPEALLPAGRLRLSAAGGVRRLWPNGRPRIRQLRRRRNMSSENWHVTRGLTGEGIAWAITTYYAYNWHPLDLALAHAGLPTVWPEARRPSSHQRALARRRGRAPVAGLAADDRGTLAQRLGGGGFRHSSPAGRIGRLGGGAQGRVERPVLHVDPLALRPLRRAPGIVGPILVGGGLVCIGVDGQADAGDAAVCAPLAGLLAAGTPRSSASGQSGGRSKSAAASAASRASDRRKDPLLCAGGGCLHGHARRLCARHAGTWSDWPYLGESPTPPWLTSPTCETCFTRLGWQSSILFPRARRRPGKRLRRSPCCWPSPRPPSRQGGSALTCLSGGSGILGRWCRCSDWCRRATRRWPTASPI